MRSGSIPPDWLTALPADAIDHAEAMQAMIAQEEARGALVYPPPGFRYRALELTPPGKVKAVILGQDPYHGAGQAMGLSFSVPEGVKLPPSLRNIFAELQTDLGIAPLQSGDLTSWAHRGVLLLNTALTVEAGKAGSHSGRGWERLTNACLAAIAERGDPAAFVLWGSHAQAVARTVPGIDSARHLVIASPHPSPLSAYRGFFGSRPFSRVNAFLGAQGHAPIDWRLPSGRLT